MSFGENFLERQYGLNRIVFWSKFSIKKIWDEPYSLLIKIFQKDYFLPYPDFNSSVRSNFPRQYGSWADKTVQVVQMDNMVQRDNRSWNRETIPKYFENEKVNFVWYYNSMVLIKWFFVFSVHQGRSIKKVVQKIFQNPQERPLTHFTF